MSLPWEPKPEPEERRPVTPAAGPADATTPYGRRALEAEAERVANAMEGTRNDTLNRAAFAVGQLVAGGEVESTEGYDTLWCAAVNVGLGQVEAHKTIESAFKAAEKDPRSAPPPEGSDGGDVAPKLFERVNFRQIWDSADAMDWLVYPILPARRLVALYSAPKVGKSLLTLELSVNIGRGTPVLGVPTERPRTVLYVDMENDPRGDIVQRGKEMGFTAADFDNVVYLSFPAMEHLDTPAGGRALFENARACGAELVVLDTVSRVVAGEENSNDTWLNFYKNTGRLFKGAGIAVLRLDHAGKDSTQGQRGGSAKSGDVDMVWRMSLDVTKNDDDTEGVQLELEATRIPVPAKDHRMTLLRRRDPLRHDLDPFVLIDRQGRR